MSNATFTTADGREISREEFQRRARARARAYDGRSTRSSLTVYPDGRQVRRDYDTDGNVTRESTQRIGVEVTDTKTGESQVLYTSQGLPAAPRKAPSVNVQTTARIDPSQTDRFVPYLRADGTESEDRFIDVQEGVSIRRDEMERRKARDGDRVTVRVDGALSRRDPETSTRVTRAIDNFQMPSLYEGITGRKSRITQSLENIMREDARFRRDIVVNRPYVLPIAAGVGFATGGLSIAAPKVATGVGVVGKGVFGYTLGSQTVKAFTSDNPEKVIGQTIGSVALVGSAGAAGAKAGSFVATKAFPIRTQQVTVNVPKETSYQRDVLTERLSPRQIVSLSRSPAQVTKSTITVTREVPDTAVSSFQRFGSSYSAPDFAQAQTAPTRIVKQVIPTSSVPTQPRQFEVLGRLTSEGLIQQRGFFIRLPPITGKKAQFSIGSDISTNVPSSQVIDITRSKITQFPTARFSPTTQPKTTVLVPPLGTSRSITQNIEDINTLSQPIDLSVMQSRTTTRSDFQIRVSDQVISDASSPSQTQPIVSSDSISPSLTSTDSPVIDIGDTFSSPTSFGIPKFNFKPPVVPSTPSFKFPDLKPRKARSGEFRIARMTTGLTTRKTSRDFEGIFNFKGLSLDLGRRRLIK